MEWEKVLDADGSVRDVRSVLLMTFFASSVVSGCIMLAKISVRMIFTRFRKFHVATYAEDVVSINMEGLIMSSHCRG